LPTRFIYFLYRLLGLIGFPFILLYVLWRGVRDRRYFHGLPERLGLLPPDLRQTSDGAIWLHAVSVGEVLSAVELLTRLRRELPFARLFVSTTTLAGRALADQKLTGLADGIFYAPIDYCFAVRRVLRTLRPAVVAVMETEIWPNLYREARRAGCGLVILNGRISDRAIGRYLKLSWFFRGVLEQPDAILAQSAISQRRYLALGAGGGKVRLGGNLKYDFEPRGAEVAEPVERFLDAAKPRWIWIAASTMPGIDAADVDEDDIVIDAWRALESRYPELLLILAPRRPERFDLAAQRLASAGLAFARRSTLPAGAGARVLLLDSIGELSGLFSRAQVVFMGGSLARRGGHNILEPAFYSVPTIVGPHMENFPEIAAGFRAGDGLVTIGSGAELAGTVAALLDDPRRRASVGERARSLALAERGATQLAVGEIARLHSASVPRFMASCGARLFLAPLAWVWRWGAALGRRRAAARRNRLSVAVVSVGGITVGGAGKTPVVQWLAERLRDRGLRPAILTRGYRRKQPEEHTIVEAGAHIPAARTGDEAQIFLRSGAASLGIGADRYGAGRLIEERFSPDVFLLDDGFQHHRLARDLDLVLIDALDPFGGGELVPLGRLREPLEALARAHAFLITRAAPGRRFDGLEARLRAYNPEAPIFKARVLAQCWVEVGGGGEASIEEVAALKATAVCGLANPGSFWQTLAEIGVKPLESVTFPDHHAYTPAQLRRVARRAQALGAKVLLITEKDFANLCPDAAQVVHPLRLLWLRIGVAVDGADDLLALITARLRPQDRGVSA
jgi:tetraacyldisaccharide 4'-kinase